MARELRKAARDSGEDVAAHHGLVRMIPLWERSDRVPRERYRLLYQKIFMDTLGDLSQGMARGVDLTLRLAGVTNPPIVTADRLGARFTNSAKKVEIQAIIRYHVL